MTGYAIDEDTNTLIRTWATGLGRRAAVVSKLPDSATPEEQLSLARELTGLSEALWRCYTHPPSAADSTDVNTEGWRRQQTRDGFAEVIPAITRPHLPDEDGALLVSYDPVEEYAHRVGRALHAFGDVGVRDAVRADVAAELSAVESAERGELSGRAAQAVELSRTDVSPVQVAAADSMLQQAPLGSERLFIELDPTAASVAAAHWLKAAADVVAAASGLPASQVLLAADDIEALPVETPNEVLDLFDFSTTAYRIVVDMVSDAMLVADGLVSDLGALLVQHENHQDDEVEEEPEPIRLTPLDPRRPARDLLEDLLSGIRGCRLLYAEYTDTDADEAAIDALFAAAVREEAARNNARVM